MDVRPERDRSVGALVGLAVGDALGTTNEFKRRDTYPHLTGMVGGGPFDLKPGEWTDDTSMALALAASLIECDGLDERDLMDRFCNWYRKGEYSHNGRCFDIGIATEKALRRYANSGDPVAGDPDPNSAGNGSLMRLAPVPLRYWRDRKALSDVARRQSMTTHAALTAGDACAAYSELIADAIAGSPKSQLFMPRAGSWVEPVASVMAMTMPTKQREDISSSGYVVHSMEAALWCVHRAESFSEAVLIAANLGDDADTVAAITGQLAGAIWGFSSIPADWVEKLAWRDRIVETAHRLFNASTRDK